MPAEVKMFNNFTTPLQFLRKRFLTLSYAEKILIPTILFSVVFICVLSTKKAYADEQTCGTYTCQGDIWACQSFSYNAQGDCTCLQWGTVAYPEASCAWNSSYGLCYCDLGNQQQPPPDSPFGCDSYQTCCFSNSCSLGNG